jgi:hypothetical protein
MLHIFNKIIDETTVARSKWQGNSERRRESVLPFYLLTGDGSALSS